jgi:Concanavalin A-like lectin/glucanases superfamily
MSGQTSKNFVNSLRTRRSRLAGIFMLLLLMVEAAFGQAYQWKSVAIKGGGFITGIITHPTAPGVVYCRTDIGGAYRWNSTNNSWIPLLDFAADSNLDGVESLAIDPSDSNRVYIAASRGSPAVFLASTNRGATFSQSTPPFLLNGNVDGRSNGERLAVDPNANNILYYGSRLAGLYKSVNYGTSWSPVGSFPVGGTLNSVGLVFVQFIQGSGSAGGATPVIFVGVSQVVSNLFRSTDGGVTWTNVPTAAPATQMPHHAAQDGLGNMYLTFNDNQGPNNITAGSVIKLNLSTLASSAVTPPKPSGAQGGFAGVSVDKQNPNSVVVSTMDRWYANPPNPAWDVVNRSINGGASWTEIGPTSLPNSASAPWSVARSPHWAGDVEIDPSNSNRCFFITGYGVIGCTNLTSGGTVNWSFMNDGLEETVPLSLVSPPSGPYLMSAHGDIGAFRHFNLDVSPPLTDYFSTHRGTSYGIDFAENNPGIIARLFSGSPYGCYSLNGGGSWTDFPASPSTTANGSGNLAVSADGGRFVWIPQNSIPYYSTNLGTDWIPSTGAPVSSRAPVADRVNTNKFYIYSGTTFYVSMDGGASFNPAGTTTSSGGGPLCAVFGREGHVLLPLGNGLWRTTNSGASLVSLPIVQQASYVGVGRAAPGQSYPAIFISGQIGGVKGLYRSDNEGVSWTRINDGQHQFGLGSIHVLCGDPRAYGRVYFGTEGRGIIYGEPGNQPPGAVTDLAAAGGNTQITLAWSAVSGADSYTIKRANVSGGPYVTITNGLTATTYGDSGLTNGIACYYVVSGTNNFGAGPDSNEASGVPAVPVPNALYAMENNALDTSGNGNDGSPNAVSYVAGKVGSQAAQFNGSSSYIQIPRSISTDFTVAMWVKTADAGNSGTQWWQGKGLVDGEVSGSAADWGTVLLAGKFAFGVGNPDTTISSTVSINDGTWHHVAATRNSTSGAMNVYVDGILRGSGTGPTGSRTAPPNLRIGGIQAGAGFLTGTIDDVRLYGQALNGADVSALAIVPPAPTNLAAIAGDAQATLSWAMAATASYYKVKRATTSGVSYTVVATNVPGLSFTDAGLNNGTNYYYAVSAVNPAGEGNNSTESGVRPVSPTLTTVGFTLVDNQLQLAWPQDHTGWRLQVQTNSSGSGLGTNWAVVPGSASTNQFILPSDAANGSVFFRLVYP